MPRRTITVDNHVWEIVPSGRVTQYQRDEFSVVFVRQDADETRVARYSPLRARSPEESLAEMPERELRDLFARSQPSWTAPETEYRR